MPVSNDKFYKPEEALHELQLQETILKTAIDVQVALRILVDKEMVTREEVQKYREEVSNTPKYNIKSCLMIFAGKKQDSKQQKIILKTI